MTYEEAKRLQIEAFKRGQYLVVRCCETHHPEFGQVDQYDLIPAASRQVAEESITRDVIAEIKRLPARLRILPGGKT